MDARDAPGHDGKERGAAMTNAVRAALFLLLAAGGAVAVMAGQMPGEAGASFVLSFLVLTGVAWRGLVLLAGLKTEAKQVQRLIDLAVPALFGIWIVTLWQAGTVGFGVPQVLLPSPGLILQRLATSAGTLADDFRQTFLQAVIIGYLLGCGSGFAAAILADRVPFLARGLLPLGNLASALPIVGVAPIMVMWFGFDWPSKAAVVVIMTFFPMLVNTVAGLAAAGVQERELLRTYAAGYWQSLFALRLPAAMPFVFNALKINSTLALIGAIVAEFFGTPIVGMGFRISTEVGRMNLDMVWAEIVLAAVAGSAFYGLVALAERRVTFWHSSNRQRH